MCLLDREKKNLEEQNTIFPKREERVSLGETERKRPRQNRNQQPKKERFVLPKLPKLQRPERQQKPERQQRPPQPQRQPQQQRPQRPPQQHEWIPDEGLFDRLVRMWDEKKDDLPWMHTGIPKWVFGAVTILLLSIILYFSFAFPNGTEVLLDGNRVGILEQRNVTAEEITIIVEEQLATSVGAVVQLNETITTENIHISSSDKKDVGTEEYLIPKIRNMVTYQVNAAVLYVDGRKELSVATLDSLNSILEELQSPYLVDIGENVTVSWVETVKTAEEFVDMEEIISASDALATLQTVRWTTGVYTVQQGDALYTIATKNNTTVEEILSLNPGMTINSSIYVGEELNMMISEPKLSVQTVELQEYTMVEPKDYEYQYDSSMATGQKQVLQQGRAGQKLSIVEVTRINGFVVSEEEISKEIIVEPITEIIVEGTG